MKERTDMLNTVRTETTANIAKAKSEIEAQVKKARTTLEKDASVMAATISTSILGRQVGGPR
jgi:F-type H+-transporting ATPase subunit b